MTGSRGLVLRFPLTVAVLSKRCQFIRGLASDNFLLSVIGKNTYLHTAILISGCTHTHTFFVVLAHTAPKTMSKLISNILKKRPILSLEYF